MRKLFTIFFIYGVFLLLCGFWNGAGVFPAASAEDSPSPYNASVPSEKRQQAITGTVVAFLSNEPLVGVNIIIKGSLNGTTTDVEGRFTLQASSRDTLVFSFIGYETKEVPLQGRSVVHVTLMEGIGILGELQIVSTGYQQLPKERATGSFVHLDTELINRSAGAGILERLEDVTSSLIFNRNGPVGEELSIRGRSTLFANTQPLIVVDNFPYEGDINNINPNDVESITVLKDAAAASIWGARAGNGVIVITTKKGVYNQAPQISFNSNVTIGERPDPFYEAQLSVSDFVDVEQMLFDQGYYFLTEFSPAKAPLTPVVELLIAQRDGEISADEANSRIEALRQQDIRQDYEDYLYRKSIGQQYAINVKGGSEYQHYRLSAGYDHNLKNIMGNRSERFTLNARHTLSLLKDKLEISTGVNYVKGSKQENGLDPSSLVMGSGKPMYPYGRLADVSGNPLAITQDYRERFVLQAEEDGLLDWRYRPLEEIALIENTSGVTGYRINSRVSYEVVPQLHAEVLYQYWGSQRSDREFYPQETYFVRDLINTFTYMAEDGSLVRPIPEGSILDMYNEKTASHNLRGQLRYEASIGDSHRVSAIAGYEVRDLNSEATNQRFYGYNDDLATSSLVNYAGLYRRYNWPLFTKHIPHVDDISSVTDRFVSYYANAAYTYDNRYTLSLSGRRDMSNLFGVDANQRGVPLWSAGFAWNLSREGFYSSETLPYLKLRTTYGYNGNIDKSVSAYTTARIDGVSDRTGLPYGRITNPPNPELRWEQVKVLNLGMDFELKEGVVNGNLEYYIKEGLDLIGDAPFPPSSGVTEFRGNTASTRSSGVDIVLHTRNINRAFQWETSFLFSHIKEEVTDYKAEESIPIYLSFGSGEMGLPVPLEGKPLFSLYSYQWAGLDPETGDPRGYLDGEVSKDYGAILAAATTENIVYHGPARPTTFGALRNTFSWNNFSLSVNISYRLGYYFRKNSIQYYNLLAAEGGHSDYALRWQHSGDESITQVPSMPDGRDTNRNNLYTYSEVLVEKGDHVRLEDVRLSYTLKRDRFPSLPFSSLQLYAYAENLGIIWKATDKVKDPDFQDMPSLRAVSLGLRVNF